MQRSSLKACLEQFFEDELAGLLVSVLTWATRSYAIKASADGEDAARAALERKWSRRIALVLRAQFTDALPPDSTPQSAQQAVGRLRANQDDLRKTLLAMLLDGARLGTNHASDQVDAALGTVKFLKADANLLIDWALINEAARQWASQYVYDLVNGITDTSVTLLQGALSDFIAGNLDYQDVVEQLTPSFGADRADLIATTEITRSFAAGNVQAWQSTGVIQWFRWNTANDEMVCDICEPLNGQIFPLNSDTPPGHPNCRCWVSASANGPDGA